MRIYFYYPIRFSNIAASYACMEIAKGMKSKEVDVLVVGESADTFSFPDYYQPAIPRFLERVIYKFYGFKFFKRFIDFRFFSKLKQGDVVYLWPHPTLSILPKLKKRGHIIVIEMINSAENNVVRILSEAYTKLGVDSQSIDLNEWKVAEQYEMFSMADYIFSPSPCVTDSLIKAGVFETKILQSSYGLKKADRLTEFRPSTRTHKVKFLFTGRIGVRKGIHNLLKYWCKADIDGELILVGNIEAPLPVQELIKPYLQRGDIKHIGFVDNLIDVMRDADVFILPSLEEGSPLVTYDAIGQGLPCLVTPMGGGGIIKHGVSGYIIEPEDETGWIEAIQAMQNLELRNKLGFNAWQDSENYLWPVVAAKRQELLLSKLKAN